MSVYVGSYICKKLGDVQSFDWRKQKQQIMKSERVKMETGICSNWYFFVVVIVVVFVNVVVVVVGFFSILIIKVLLCFRESLVHFLSKQICGGAEKENSLRLETFLLLK